MSLSSVLSAHYLEDKSPLWHKCGSYWACVAPSLREGNQHFVSSPFSLRWLHTRTASALHLCKQLHSLRHGEGIFHGLICLATDDSLGIASESLLTLLTALRRKTQNFECQPALATLPLAID